MEKALTPEEVHQIRVRGIANELIDILEHSKGLLFGCGSWFVEKCINNVAEKCTPTDFLEAYKILQETYPDLPKIL